jgi:hypothetical protein
MDTVNDDEYVGMTVGLAINEHGYVLFGAAMDENGNDVQVPIVQGGLVKRSELDMVRDWLAFVIGEEASDES